MKFLNYNNVPFLTRESANYRSGDLLYHAKVFDKHDYFVVEFFSKIDLERISSVIPENIRTDLKNKKIKLLISNTHEAFNDYTDTIYEFIVVDLGIPESQITLLTEAADIDKEIIVSAKKFNKELIEVEWIRVFEMATKRQSSLIGFNQHTLELKDYQKKFLNFNRRWRIHRPILVFLLYLNDILDKGYVSLADADDHKTWNENIKMSMLAMLKGHELHDIILENYEKTQYIKPLYLDTMDLTINQADLTDSTRYYYNNTYFSLITETNYFKNHNSAIFFSEKIFKPIAEIHPFIVVGRPKSLEKLRLVGYKTFSSIINESYDLEEDDAKRLSMIVEETKRLSNLSKDELKDFLIIAKKTCLENYRIFHAKKSFATKII